jgi:hypothetical protein
MPRGPQDWLLGLCDPRGSQPGLGKCALRGKQLTHLRAMADRHGVLPALVRNLRQSCPEASQELEQGGTPARLAQLAAMGLFLRARALEVFGQLNDRGIPALLIKGPLIAQRAYRPTSLRTYIDIDLLVPRNAWVDVREVMMAAGYEPIPSAMKYDSGYGEEQWLHPGHPGCSFEVHWNLVNSPTIRRGLSVTYENLDPQPAVDPFGEGLSPAALLLIAAVHGAASHAFDKLQHLCDVAQIARSAAGAVDHRQLADMTRATGAELAVHAALRLTGRLLGDEACLELLSRLDLNKHASASRILDRQSVIAGQNTDLGSRLRRRMFRQALKRHSP